MVSIILLSDRFSILPKRAGEGVALPPVPFLGGGGPSLLAPKELRRDPRPDDCELQRGPADLAADRDQEEEARAGARDEHTHALKPESDIFQSKVSIRY